MVETHHLESVCVVASNTTEDVDADAGGSGGRADFLCHSHFASVPAALELLRIGLKVISVV